MPMRMLKEVPMDAAAFFEVTPDLVCIAGRDGYLKSVNQAVLDKLGYSREELLSRPIESFIYEEDRQRTRREREKLLNGNLLHNFENRYYTHSGDIIWLEWTSIYFPDREMVLAIAKDISSRKKMETEIEDRFRKIKGLAEHFKQSIERDRKYFAVELHEELAQLASVVKMDLDWIKQRCDGQDQEIAERVDHASLISELLINTIRRISFSISPRMMDDLGLRETIEWQCQEFTRLTGIACSFIGNFGEDGLSQEQRMDIFRIFQEALTNVMYHAKAGQAQVKLEESGGQFTLEVADDGIGFRPESYPESHGLTRMRQRAASINAALEIESQAEKGTRVILRIGTSGSA